MKYGIRIFLLCLLVFIIPAKIFAQESENLKRVLQVLDKAQGRNYYYEERSLLADYGGFESSVVVYCDAARAGINAGTFIFAVPLYAGFAVDTALELVEKLSERTPDLDTIVAFLGGERNALPESFGGISHKGLQDLLTLAHMPESCILSYFIAEEPPQKISVLHGIRGYAAPMEIIKPLPHLFKSRKIPLSFEIRYNTIYKLGLVHGPEVLSIIKGEEIFGFILKGESASGKTVLPENLAALLLEYSGRLNFPLLNPDIHYSFLTFPGGNILFTSEWVIVILFLVMAGILLFIYLLRSVRNGAILLFHVRLFPRFFWIVLILFVLLAVSVRLSSLVYYSLVSAFGLSFSTVSNGAGFALAMLLAVALFYSAVFVLDSLRIYIKERFCGYSAVVLAFLGTIIAAFIDISYIPVFIWVLLFAFLGASVSKPQVVLLSAFLLPAFALLAVFNVFETGHGRIAALFLARERYTLTSLNITLQAALLFLPVFLLVRRSAILASITPNKLKLIFLPVLIALSLGGMTLQIWTMKRQLLPERRYINETGIPDHESLLTLSLTDIAFQDSRIISLTIAAKGNPVRFDVSAVSGSDKNYLLVYSASVPFERNGEGTRISFLLGERPPNPLSMEIVLPLGFEGKLETAALYNTWDLAIDPGRKPESKDYVLLVSKNIDLELQ